MKKGLIMTLLVISTLTFIAVAFAVNAPTAKKKRPFWFVKKADAVKPEDTVKTDKAKKTTEGLSEKEMVNEIMDMLDQYEEIVNLVPGLKKHLDVSGKINYTFEGVNIERLDREKLEKLYFRIRQQKVKMHTDEINRQLETVRRLQETRNVAGGGGAVRSVMTAPPTPQVPPAPPSSPKVPRAPRAPAPPSQPKR